MPDLPLIAQVVVELPLETPLDYHIPPALRAGCRVGQRVLVPVGPRQLLGYIVGLSQQSAVATPRDLLEILDDTPLLTPDLLRLTRWVAEYYLCAWGQVLKAAVPDGFRVQSVPVYTLTEEAAAHPEHWPAGQAGALLQALAQQGPQAPEELARQSGVRQPGALLRRLQQQGLMRQEQRRVPPRTRQRFVSVVRLCLSAAEAQTLQQQLQARAPAQAATLALLQGQAVWELPAIRQRLAGAATAIKRFAQQGVVELVQEERLRLVAPAPPPHPPPIPVLNQVQQHALWQIETRLADPDGVPILLYGVTGSGKTEVYMRAIATGLRQGKTALVLVPEISLTDQVVNRFAARFPAHIAVLHSGLSAGERFDEWRRLARGEARIAIGARSAVFAPLPALGLIIVDEEHDTSYKQEDTPRYNARDVAIVRAQQCGAVVVLGSATPALETFHHARNGKYVCLTLPHRVEDRPLPRVTIVDQRAQTTPNERIISTSLYQAIAVRLQRREQCLILINRRGFAAYLQCRDCGLIPQCTRCSVSLTYHRRERALKCHYCDWTQPAPGVCPQCQATALQPFGLGTQQVEDALQALLPHARITRMDRDTTRGKAAHQRILRAVGGGEVDILVGTQMIAKGHDYPNITLVGVVSADATLAIPDFRAPERLFQLLTQVAGRAGRGTTGGEVFIQTFRPEHYSVSFAHHHDFLGFFQDEIRRRQTMLYPPYTRLARLLLDSTHVEHVQAASQWLESVLRPQLSGGQLVLLGPAEAPIAKIQERYRWHLLLKSPSSRLLHQCLRTVLAEVTQARQHLRGIRLSVDIDPLTFM